MYEFVPLSFGEDEKKHQDPNEIEELRKQVKALQDEMQSLKKNLPDAVKDEVKAVKKEDDKEKDILDKEWRARSVQDRWTMEGGPRIHNLQGRMLVGPGPGYQGAYGVLFDLNTGTNVYSKEGADRLNFYRAKITPFIQFDTWGAEMALNVRKFLKNEVVKGELRDQISDRDFESAFVYYRPINNEYVEVVAYLGQVDEPFVREVVDQSVFTNKSILDKYRLNTSMAVRVDVGIDGVQNAHKVYDRTLWIQAASFNLDPNNRNFEDFAFRVMLSLSVINKFADVDLDFSGIQAWGGYAQVKSRRAPIGEHTFLNPPDSQQLSVFGMQFDLKKLSGSDLGVVYGEFVKRLMTGNFKDYAWVIGYEVKLPKKEPGSRDIEIGVRYQEQKDDPNVLIDDGRVIQASVFYPLLPQNLGVRGNVGYIIKSEDPKRDKQFIFSADLEVIW